MTACGHKKKGHERATQIAMSMTPVRRSGTTPEVESNYPKILSLCEPPPTCC